MSPNGGVKKGMLSYLLCITKTSDLLNFLILIAHLNFTKFQDIIPSKPKEVYNTRRLQIIISAYCCTVAAILNSFSVLTLENTAWS